MTEELKPCPFCGYRAYIEEDRINGKVQEWVECANPRCGAMGPMWRKCREHKLAVKYWNQRVIE